MIRNKKRILTNRDNRTLLPLKDFVQQAKQGTYKEEIAELRKAIKMGDEKKASRILGKLPRLDHRIPEEKARIVVLEYLDWIDESSLDEEELAKCDYAVLLHQDNVLCDLFYKTADPHGRVLGCFISAEGNSLVVLVKVDADLDNELFSELIELGNTRRRVSDLPCPISCSWIYFNKNESIPKLTKENVGQKHWDLPVIWKELTS